MAILATRHSLEAAQVASPASTTSSLINSSSAYERAGWPGALAASRTQLRYPSPTSTWNNWLKSALAVSVNTARVPPMSSVLTSIAFPTGGFAQFPHSAPPEAATRSQSNSARYTHPYGVVLL